MAELMHTKHCLIESEPTMGGELVTITADEGYHIIVGDKAYDMAEMRVIGYDLPTVGRTYAIDGHGIEVNDWRIDESGACWVEDASTKAWWRWPERR